MARARNLTGGRPPRRRRALLLATLLCASAVVEPLFAQSAGARAITRIQPEARADFIDARAATAHLGVGFSVPAGTYVRVGLVGAAGQAWNDGDAVAAGRVDAIARFVADPLREFRWAPYVAGGLGALYDEAERWRAVIVGVLGVEGPALGAVIPAFEVGFGGGTRIGVVVRRAVPGRR